MYCMRLAGNRGYKISPSQHHRTILSGYIFAIKARINTHNHFMARFPGSPRWTGNRRELLHFTMQGMTNTGRHADHLAGRHSVRTITLGIGPHSTLYFVLVYHPTYVNVTCGCILVPPDEYESTVYVQWQCGLVSNYCDHLLSYEEHVKYIQTSSIEVNQMVYCDPHQ